MKNVESYKSLPNFPGVYLFVNKESKVIYVGKAINLKNRVGSYFQKNLLDNKTQALVSNISKISFVEVSSDIEALLLEAKLIKQYQPFFNSRLKDDKDYLYIIFTKEDFPKVITGRKHDTRESLIYFGPFTTATATRDTLRLARKIFPFRTTCRPNSNKACLSFHLGLCPGVCIGVVGKTEYQKNLKKLEKFLNGETTGLMKKLEMEMEAASKAGKYELAAKLRDSLLAIKKTTRRYEEVEKYLSGPNAIETLYLDQAKSLAQVLHLRSQLKRIECYDISNFQGKESVGSMVVLQNGKINKSEYRRFKIKTVSKINDTASIAEVLTRRFKNVWELPDLIVVDGGRGQLNAAQTVLNQFNLKIPVIGLAKKNEEIYRTDSKLTLKLARNSPAILLIQRIRDEAHRFAISYHRKLRSKLFLPTH